VARRLGKIKKGGVPDVDAAARSVLNDWNAGKISYYTVPPDAVDLPAHVGASIVSEWGKEFDIEAATRDEEETLGDSTMADVDDGAPAPLGLRSVAPVYNDDVDDDAEMEGSDDDDDDEDEEGDEDDDGEYDFEEALGADESA
jgi:nuclear GTP-binding protein